MMYEEFENLAGYEVSRSDYINIIEPMYMATTLDKEEFIKCLDKKRFALKAPKSYIKEMRKLAAILKENCTHYTDTETKEKLNQIITAYIERMDYRSVHFFINERELWSCFYPVEVVIFDCVSYETLETISLI